MRLAVWLVAALEEISANRTRTLLAMISVVIGVWSVTVVVSAGEIGQATLAAGLERTLGRPATVNIAFPRVPVRLGPASLREMLDGRMRRYGVGDASPMETVSAAARYRDHNAGVLLKGVYPSLAAVRLMNMAVGRWLDDGDSRMLAPIVVLNSTAAGHLGLDPATAVGARLWLGTSIPVKAVVAGVVASTSTEDSSIYLPAAVLERWGAPSGASISFSYVARISPDKSDTLIAVMKHDLSAWAGSDGVTIQRIDGIDTLQSGLQVIQVVLAGIAGVSLLTGGMGLLNLGLASVRDRVHEFGIRRAFGASIRSIFVIVLAETMSTTVMAGLAGVGLALLTTLLVPTVLSSIAPGEIVTSTFPTQAALVGLAISVTLGAVVGVVPARQATKIDVIRAIRY
ncbi:MAG: ABC transporter permease [Candidatus Dormibacteraceae bacterium]